MVIDQKYLSGVFSLRIGIIRTSSIGDVILGTACLDYLRQVDLNAEIIWVGRKPSLTLVHQCWPSIVPLELPSRSSSKLHLEILEKLKTCDAVIDLQTNFRSRIMMRSLRRAKIPVFVADKAPWFRTKLVVLGWLRGRLAKLPTSCKMAPTLQYRMMLDSLHRALTFLKKSDGAALERSRPSLPKADLGQIEQSWILEMSFGNWVAVSPGASHEPKRAPTEVFADILRELADQCTGQTIPGLVFLGSAADRIAAVTLMDQLSWPGAVINLAGKLSLEQTMLALAKVKTLLSNDSGLAHIAEAVGTPVAVLFGPTSEAFGFSPQRPNSESFSADVGCRPCSKHGKTPCRYGDQMCFRSIDVKRIALHLKSLMSVRTSV
jgi:ADP-heptose:LPS heptosyltransferase